MEFPNSFGYDPFYRSDPHFHSPTSLLDLNEYIHPTNYLFSSYRHMSCHHCQDPIHYSESVFHQGVHQDQVKINSTHFKDLRANPIHQILIWRVEIVLNFHGINHIRILKQIGPTLNHQLYLRDLTISMRNRRAYYKNVQNPCSGLWNPCSKLIRK